MSGSTCDSTIGIDRAMDDSITLLLQPSLVTLSELANPLIDEEVLSQCSSFRVLKSLQDIFVNLDLSCWCEVGRLPVILRNEPVSDLLA